MNFFLRILFLAGLLFGGYSAIAQERGAGAVVRGRIIDENARGIPGAEIGLHKQSDSSLVKIVFSDSSGVFAIDNVQAGEYVLSGVRKSYKRRFLVSLRIYDTSETVGAGDLSLTQTIRQHEMAVIKQSKPLMERQLDRLVVNIGSSLLFSGNSAMEVLSKLPGISIAPGKRFSVNGANDFLLVIDGKGYRASSEQANQLLNSIRSDNIDKIEIYTNPPPRFDAQGLAVINIILKKDKAYSDIYTNYANRIVPVQGQNGWSRRMVSAGINLRYAVRKFRFVGSFGFTANNDGLSVEDITTDLPSVKRNTSKDESSVVRNISASLAASYSFNRKNDLSIHLNYTAMPKLQMTAFSNDHFISKSGGVDSLLRTRSNNRINNTNPELLLNYIHRFTNDGRKGISTTIVNGTFNSDFFNSFLYNNLSQNASSNFDQLQQYQVKVFATKVDFVTPLNKITTMDAGVKYTNVTNTDIYDRQGLEDNRFRFREEISAVYANFRFDMGKSSIQAGLRGEYTLSTGKSTLVSTGVVKRNYFSLFPSVFWQREFKSQYKVNLSYSRRITRPNYADFNPYLFRSFYDPFSSQQGNLLLSPQFSNRFEAAFSHKRITTSVAYTYRRNLRTQIASNAGGGNVNMEAVNTNSGDWSAYTGYSIPLNKFWEVGVNAGLFYYNVFLLNGVERRQWAGNFFVTGSYQASERFSAECAYRYNPVFVSGYWKYKSNSNLSVAMRYVLIKQRFFLNLSVDDILGTSITRYETDFGSIRSSSENRVNERYLRLGLSYRFATGNKFQMRSRQGNDFGEIRYSK
jgi:hypothetical protein